MQLTKLLVEDGIYEVFPACLSGEGVLREEMEKLGFKQIPEFRLTSFFNLNFLKQVKKCARFIRENKIDIIHTHDFYTNVFGMSAAVLAGVKTKIASKGKQAGCDRRRKRLLKRLLFKEPMRSWLMHRR